jgi:hypothetical protein
MLEQSVRRGEIALAGCSAGALFLGPRAFDSDKEELSEDGWESGMNLFPTTYIGPHWDALDSYVPGLRDFFIASVPPGCSLLALDESTGVVGDGVAWTVTGAGYAHALVAGIERKYAAGDWFELPVLKPDSHANAGP